MASGLLRGRIVPVSVGLLTAVAVLIGGVVWWQAKQRFEKTDNAFVAADKASVTPQIDGFVAEVLVADNQAVRAGDVVVRLDAADLRAKLVQAEANAQALEAAIRSVGDKAALEQAMIAQKAAAVAAANAQASLAGAEQKRYGALADKGWVSSQRVQVADAAADQAAASVNQAQATLEAERRTATSLTSARDQTVSQALAARAAVDQARLALARAEIRAPLSGVVGARAVRPGQYVRPGAALMSIVPLGEAFVVANFKETQLGRLRIGQPVEVKADAFGGASLPGRIDSFAPATGSEFALIPVENAVGNFTKIAQRVPVKIRIDRGAKFAAALRPGLSVSVKVDVRENTGPSFSEVGVAPAAYARRGEPR